MSKEILIIGGTRFFGIHLVNRLVDAGHRVTVATRGQASDPFEDKVGRIRVDRRDRAAMQAAFADKSFDLVYDQMCYSPHDAAISLEVFGGRAGHYVMSSTIEVYDRFLGTTRHPLREADLDLASEIIDETYPWQLQELSELRYGAGKRQAEALLYRDGRLPVTSVRIGHVLAGPEDFTGRLKHYVVRAKKGLPLAHSKDAGSSSFIDVKGIVDLLFWVAQAASPLGPINAASDGPLTAVDIHRRVCEQLDLRCVLAPVAEKAAASFLSPFDYPGSHRMDTQKARDLGHAFRHTDEWLDALIRQHAAALV